MAAITPADAAAISGQVELGQQDRVGVSADGEEGGLAEAHLAAEAHQEVQSDGGQREDHREHRDIHHRGRGGERDHDDERDEDRASDPGVPRLLARNRPESVVAAVGARLVGIAID